MTPCNCIDKINERLAQSNSRLVLGFTFGTDSKPRYEFPSLRTEKINTRSRVQMGAVPSCCPFCGTRYRTDEPATASDGETK